MGNCVSGMVNLFTVMRMEKFRVNMKVIFLDIDGVLAVNHRERDQYGSLFHPEFVDNLKRIIDETEAKIVCSSSWRKSGLAIIREMWDKRRLPGEILDVTPSLYLGKGVFYYNGYLDQNPTPKTFGYSVPRGSEIEYWLEYFGKFKHISWSDDLQKEYLDKALVKNYVILDDDSDMLYSQRDHFVKCSGNKLSNGAIEGYGLTRNRASKAIEILNTPIVKPKAL